MTTTADQRTRLPAELRPEQVVAVVDTREQLPLDLAPLQSVAGTLPTGDYSVQGLESIVAVERKSLADASANIASDSTGRYNACWPIRFAPSL